MMELFLFLRDEGLEAVIEDGPSPCADGSVHKSIGNFQLFKPCPQRHVSKLGELFVGDNMDKLPVLVLTGFHCLQLPQGGDVL